MTAMTAAQADDIEIPTWVPPEFRAGYRKVAAERGEENAAAWARRMKNGEPTVAALSPRKMPLVELRSAGDRSAKPKPAVARKAVAPRAPVAKVPSPTRAVPDSAPAPIEAKPASTATDPAPAGAITIHELRDHRCHWPFGDPRDDGFRYCGAPVAAATRERGRFYCDGHMAAAAASSPAKGKGR